MTSLPPALINLGAPDMLGGLLLLSLPFIAHVLQRSLKNFHIFPSVRFAKTVPEGHRKRHRLRQWLLLLLRALAVTTVVLAFAGPQCRRVPEDKMLPGQGATVILLDITPSMGRQQNGVSLLDEAKGACRRILDDAAREGDLAGVVLMDTPSQPLLSELTAHLGVLKEEVEALTISPRRATPGPAVEKALQLLEDHSGPARLVLISDFQTGNWPATPFPGLPARISWSRIDLSEGPFVNLSIHPPVLSPARPLAQQPVRIQITIDNRGPDLQTTTLQLMDQDNELARRSISISPGKSHTETFVHTFNTSGLHPLTARLLNQDALAFDNRSGLAVNVSDRPDLLLVTDSDPGEPGSAGFYLQRALAPHNSADDPVTVTLLRGIHLQNDIPPTTQAVVLGGKISLTPEAAKALGDYLGWGGNLILFAGEPDFASTAHLLNQSLDGGVLPWTPGQFDVRASEQPAFWTTSNLHDPVVRGFDTGINDILVSLPFFSRWNPNALHPEARTVLQYTDGLPAVSLRTLASGGKCLVVNASPHQNLSGLGPSGFFVALLQNLLSETSNRNGTPPTHPADPFSLTTPVKDLNLRSVRILGPDTKPVFGAENLLQGDNLITRIPYPALTGLYRLQTGQQFLNGMFVTPDLRESEPRSLTTEQRDALFPEAGQSHNLNNLRAGEAITPPRQLPIWGWFLLGGLILLSVESFWLGALRR